MADGDKLRKIGPYVRPETAEALGRIKAVRGGTVGTVVDGLVQAFGELPEDVSTFLAEACDRGMGDIAAGSWDGDGEKAAAALRRVRAYLVATGGVPMCEVPLEGGRFALVPSSWVMPNKEMCGKYIVHVDVRGAGGAELSAALVVDEPVEECSEADRSKAVDWLAAHSDRFKAVLDGRDWSVATATVAAYVDLSKLGDGALVVMRTLMPIESYGGAEPPYGAAVYKGGRDGDGLDGKQAV